MPATRAANRDPQHHQHQHQRQPRAVAPTTPSTPPNPVQPAPGKTAPAGDDTATVRLHVTPFTPPLLKTYLGPALLPLAKNVEYHAVQTFPDKGFGYLELPAMEAQKLKKKLNGSILKGSKVRIEDAKPEKRKAGDGAEAVDADEERAAKRAKKDKKRKKEQSVIEGVELPEGRKVKRGWTEPKEKSKKDKKRKNDKAHQKESKYTKEPELLFKTKLTPVAAAELARKEKGKDKKKDKKKSKSKREVIVHEFEHNTKQPSFLKSSTVSMEKKPATEYVDGKGWVDEDGNVVEPETGKVRNRRALELVNSGAKDDDISAQPTVEKKPSATPDPQAPKSSPKVKSAKKAKAAKTPPSSSEEEDSSAEDASSVVSSSSEDASSSESDSDAESTASTPAPPADTPQMTVTPSSPEDKKTVHPLEALFKRPKPSLSKPEATPTSTPVKSLAPINTSFSFFGNADAADGGGVDAAGNNPPVTPFTKQDLEWRGLRSAAPTPDTAAIGRRFSFPWRTSSQEADDEDDDMPDADAVKQLSSNTKANASRVPDAIAEEDEDAEEEKDGEGDGEEEEEEKEESEFAKKFWENRGDWNRAYKKRRRDALKAKRLRENRKIGGGRGRV